MRQINNNYDNNNHNMSKQLKDRMKEMGIPIKIAPTQMTELLETARIIGKILEI